MRRLAMYLRRTSNVYQFKGKSALNAHCWCFEIESTGCHISEEVKFRQKLDEFLARKGNLVFRKLEAEDKPLLESRLEERKSEGNYSVTPSLDYYLPLDEDERLKEFFKMVQVGDIVIAEVHSKTVAGLIFKLLCCDGGKRAYLEDLNIKGTCQPNQTVPFMDPTDTTRTYEEEDKVRLEILDINYESRKLGLGMKGTKLSNDMRHAFPLGPIHSHEDLPRQYLLTKNENKSRRRRSFEYLLESHGGFQNPNCTVCLGTSLGVFSTKHSLLLGLSGKFAQKDMANELRSAQNAKWAQHNVTIGIRHFKQGNQVEAFQCLNKAIIIDPQNVEGLVARGALYANNGGFEKAIEDFESALKNNPDHFNGRKYLAETLVVVGKSQQENNKPEESITSYSKCLSILPEHKESILTLMSIHENLEKIDIARLSGSSGSKALELKEKLRLLITQEIAKKKLGYYEKMEKNPPKTKTQDSSDSESSSSDSSESDSGSSSDDELSRKDKKKKRKKSRKSKKSKKFSKTSKELSLSPFSKKLAGQDVASTSLGGFNSSSSFTNWGGQQVGMNQIAGNSDDESQHSSRKSRGKKKSKRKKEKQKKKKRSSSTSSDSDSDSREKRKKRNKKKVITDFGEIEEQLTAFFSKCEQGKESVRVPPEKVKVTVEQVVDKNYINPYENSSRRIELVREESHSAESTSRDVHRNTGALSDHMGNKHPSQTVDYENYFRPQTIVRTVQNDQSELASTKFEMRFNLKPPAPPIISKTVPKVSPQASNAAPSTQSSKWRTVGAASSELPTVVITKSDYEVSKPIETLPKVAGITSGVPLMTRPPTAIDSDNATTKPEREIERQYRGRKRTRSRSRSHSRSKSRSRSRSPRWRGRRDRRSPSPVLSRSRRRISRSRSRGRRRSYSRSRSRSGDRRLRRSPIGKPVRFFQGYHPAVRSRYQTSQSYRGGGMSKSRNRFRSRSDSRSHSRSVSPRKKDKSKDKNGSPQPQTDADAGTNLTKRSRDSGNKSSENVEKKSSSGNHYVSSNSKHENSEIHVLGLRTKKVADVEELLDKHKAHRKEEMREMNPEFFRQP
ncbi:unnamed protein product [Allacma fusca]|uniref:Tetratricopeptide repeat protein 14 n=1 Tax=Allacma fusca TaxID=39272 RepID=A0A8J2LTR6_9HEXA|nr:unnamed protein product [Allacma fusca]